jgi:hypothetical protein
MKRLLAFVPFALVAIAFAQEAPMLSYSVPQSKTMVTVNKDGKVFWLTDKDETIKSVLLTLAQTNQENAQLKQNNQALLEAVNSNKGCVDIVKKFLIAKNPPPPAPKKAMTKDEKAFVDAGKKEVLKDGKK